jgi:hypothetical protein
MTFLKKGAGRFQLFNRPQMAFLVFASPKSGTTWLQQLISHHPAAICAESRAFGNYYSLGSAGRPHFTLQKYCGVLGEYFGPTLPGLDSRSELFQRTLLRNLLDTLAHTAMAATNKKVYGEKFTPYRGTAMSAIEALAEYHPGIKFVNLTRDGRDVIASGAAQWLNHRLRQAATEEAREAAEEALRNHTIWSEDFDMFLDIWMDAAQAGLAAGEQFPNYLHVRYEEFIRNPLSHAARLFDFLGLKCNARTVRECVSATSFDQLSGGRKRGEEDINSFFRKGVAGDWKNWFTDLQHVLFEKAAGPLLARLGYEREELLCEMAV